MMTPRRRVSAATLLLLLSATSATALSPCGGTGVGWCLSKRFAGDVAGGELGFRFGEPLDVDGDGRADVGAGSRFKLRSRTLQNGSASVWSGTTGAKIREWDGILPDGLFGHWVLPVADIDGDALADVVISSPNGRLAGMASGLVAARSPKSGAEIWRRMGTGDENFGWDLAVTDDVDRDGKREILVGAPAGKAGHVYLLNGKNGALLRTYTPTTPTATFGWFVAGLGDLDGDGRGELAVGAQFEADAKGVVVGGAYVLSGATGKEIHHWMGADAFGDFGEVVAGVGDLDGDGLGEVAIGSSRTNDQSRSRPGEVWVRSGKSGNVIHHWTGTQAGELYGRMIAAIGDLDGDGVEDLAIGSPWHGRGPATRVGRVEFRTGKTGAVLGELFGDEADGWFGWHIRRAPDPEGRGRPALLVGSLRHSAGGDDDAGVIDLIVLRREGDAGR